MTTSENDPQIENVKQDEVLPESPNLKFVARVTSLPIVQKGVSTIENYSIGRLVLETANNTVATAIKYQPNAIQPYIMRVDDLGCRSLDLLETSDVKTYLTSLEAPIQSIAANIRALQDQGTSATSHLSNTISNQLQTMVDFVKNQEATPEWLKARVLSMIDIAIQQFERLRTEYSQLNPIDRAKHIALGLQESVFPILQTAQLQLNSYTENSELKPSLVTAL